MLGLMTTKNLTKGARVRALGELVDTRPELRDRPGHVEWTEKEGALAVVRFDGLTKPYRVLTQNLEESC